MKLVCKCGNEVEFEPMVGMSECALEVTMDTQKFSISIRYNSLGTKYIHIKCHRCGLNLVY